DESDTIRVTPVEVGPGNPNPYLPPNPEGDLRAEPLAPPMPTQNGERNARGEIARIRKIEMPTLQRVQVYPDDPQSAWWEVFPREAFARAQREQKLMLLLFTKITDPRCLNLSKEVFATKSFNEYVKKNLVICYLNYPNDPSDAPRSMVDARRKFKSLGFPNVIIFNPNGEVERQIRGYTKGKPVTYFRKLEDACNPIIAEINEQKRSLERFGYRDWHNPEGKMIFAQFIKRDDLMLTLRDVRNQYWTLPITRLAETDQEMAKSFPPIDLLPQ
ncbi:MAG: thioredoxin fold domain-containing protein, partial [Verrucomicrobiota bacterium]